MDAKRTRLEGFKVFAIGDCKSALDDKTEPAELFAREEARRILRL
jgi:hypothetical protein